MTHATSTYCLKCGAVNEIARIVGHPLPYAGTDAYCLDVLLACCYSKKQIIASGDNVIAMARLEYSNN